MTSIALSDLCSIMRTKNAGPFLFTLDIVFKREDVYLAVKEHALLTRELIAQVYDVPIEAVPVFETFDNVNAVKATIRRRMVAGSPGDSDVYAKNQEVPALTIRLPVDKLPESVRDGARAR